MPSLTPKSAAFAVLLTLFAQIAVGQSPPPKAESKEVEQKYSGWSVAALLNERDTLAKETSDLADQIAWMEEAKTHPPEKSSVQPSSLRPEHNLQSARRRIPRNSPVSCQNRCTKLTG